MTCSQSQQKDLSHEEIRNTTDLRDAQQHLRVLYSLGLCAAATTLREEHDDTGGD